MRSGRGWRRVRGATAAGLLAAGVLVGGSAPPAGSLTPPAPTKAKAILKDANGADKGAVLFTQVPNAIRVQVTVSGLTPGWHGFHVHTTGDCTVGAPATPF